MLSAWQKNFQQAAFRGKKFFVLSAESEIGRRTVVYEFATNDNAYSVDLGRKARRFRFEALVFSSGASSGQVYATAEELRREFQAPGPGQLIHPWLGELNVIIDSVTVREAVEEGNVTRFSISAVEVVNEYAGLKAEKDLSAAPPYTASGLFSKAGEAFGKAVTTPLASASSASRKAFTYTIGSAITEMRRVKGTIDSALDIVDTLSSDITTLGNTAASLITTPVALASSFAGLYASIFGAIASVQTALSAAGNFSLRIPSRTPAAVLRTAMQSAASFGEDDPEIPTTTAQRRIERELHDAFVVLVRASVVAAAASVVPALEYTTLDEAQSLCEAIDAIVDDLLPVVDDDIYGALQDVRAAACRYLDNASTSLPRVSQYTPIDTIPALCIAYALYGDASRESDILARNSSILNPVQVPGGVPLEVISDA